MPGPHPGLELKYLAAGLMNLIFLRCVWYSVASVKPRSGSLSLHCYHPKPNHFLDRETSIYGSTKGLAQGHE